MALDVTAYVHEELGEACYTLPRIFKELVRAGRLGQKIGWASTIIRKRRSKEAAWAGWTGGLRW